MELANSVSNRKCREQALQILELWMQIPSREFLLRMLRERQGTGFALACLFHEESLSPKELSRRLDVSTARIARLLNSMEEKELVVRQSDPADRRSVLVQLSEKGLRQVQENREMILDLLEGMIEIIGFEELSEFLSLACRVGEAFVQVSRKRGM